MKLHDIFKYNYLSQVNYKLIQLFILTRRYNLSSVVSHSIIEELL